jgi:hypothetical protein
LWANEALLVNAIVTLPGFAVRVLWVNLSWPDGSAAMLSRPPAVLAPLVADEVVELEALLVGLEVVVVGLELEVELELLLLEPPQALRARASAAAPSAREWIFGMDKFLRFGREAQPPASIHT